MTVSITENRGISLSKSGFSPPASSGCLGKGCSLVFYVLLLAIGLSGLSFLPDLYKAIEAQGWDKLPCQIITMHLDKGAKKEIRLNGLTLRYLYTVNQVQYTGSRYHYLGEPLLPKSKVAISDKYKAGSHTVCYVNPNHPQEAVLEREWQWDCQLNIYFFISGMLLLIGIFGVMGNLRRHFIAQHRQRLLAMEGDLPEPLELESKTAPLQQFLLITVFMAFWNGVTIPFCWHVVHEWQQGFSIGTLFLSLFLLPFVFIGVLLIWGTIGSFLQLFNPHVRLFIASKEMSLGSSVTFSWKVHGLAYRIRELIITLEGKEAATYQRGTTTSTDNHLFAKYELLRTSSYGDIVSGQAEFTVPADTMHSFYSTNNQIIWTAKAHGRIFFWPSMDQEFPVVILPQKGAALPTDVGEEGGGSEDE